MQAIIPTDGLVLRELAPNVSAEDVSSWLNGETVPPPRPYLEAIDLVESGRRQARQERLTSAR